MKSFVEQLEKMMAVSNESIGEYGTSYDAIRLVWYCWQGSQEQQDAQAYRDMKHVVAGLVYDIDHEPHDYSIEYQELVRKLDSGELV